MRLVGWRHPACAGGSFDSPPDDGISGDNVAEGGIPAPAMVPNADGTLSLPGTPGDIWSQSIRHYRMRKRLTSTFATKIDRLSRHAEVLSK